MNYTENLKLPQWVSSDRIRMEDFNDAMQKLDQGYTASAGSYVIGSYVGEGGRDKIVDVGFQPSFLIVSGMTEEADASAPFRYFAITGASNQENIARRVQIMASGFVAFKTGNGGVTYPDLNETGRKYDYIAFR